MKLGILRVSLRSQRLCVFLETAGSRITNKDEKNKYEKNK